MSITLTVDAGPPTDLHTPRYETFSPERSVHLLADTFLGVPAEPATFTGWGWMAWVTKVAARPARTAQRDLLDVGSEHIWAPTIKVTPKHDDT